MSDGQSTPPPAGRDELAPLRSPRVRAFGALGHPNFRKYFSGQLVSLIGGWMRQVALAWLVLELTDSAFFVGLATTLQFLPVLLLALYAGVVVDRSDKWKLIVGMQVTLFVHAGVLFAVVVTGVVTVDQILVLVVLHGAALAFDLPSRQSFLIELVGRDDLMSAISLNAGAFNAARVLGPALAGLIIGRVGIAACFLLDALSYAAMLAALFRLRLPPHQPIPRSGSAWANLKEGLAYVVRDGRARALMLVAAGMSVFGMQFLVLMPVVARDVLGLGAEGYGWLMSAVGLGAVGGGVMLAALGPTAPKGRVLLIAGLSFSLILVLFSQQTTVMPALPLLAVVGYAMIHVMATVNTLLQTRVPNRLRGRVMSLYTLVLLGLGPLGASGAGSVAVRWGAPVAVAAGGALCFVVIATAALALPQLRRQG